MHNVLNVILSSSHLIGLYEPTESLGSGGHLTTAIINKDDSENMLSKDTDKAYSG